LEKAFEFDHKKPAKDFYFALIPADSTLDTLQVKIRNGAPDRSYVEFTEFYSGKYIDEDSTTDPEIVLNPPILIDDPTDYPEIVIPVMRGNKQAEVWYLNNSTRPTTSEEFTSADSVHRRLKPNQLLLIKPTFRRAIETSGSIDSLISQEVGLFAAGELDPGVLGPEVILQITLVNRNERNHRSEIRCYNLDSWQELWRFEVPCGVVMHMGLKDDSNAITSHLFILRGDYQGNSVNGMTDSTSYAFKLNLDGNLIAEPLPLGPTNAAWHIENSYPLPGSDNRFLLYGYNPNGFSSSFEIIDAVTLEVIKRRPVDFAEDCYLIPDSFAGLNSFRIIASQNQHNFSLYDEYLTLQKQISLNEPYRVLFWLDGLRGERLIRNGSHLMLGGLHTGRLLLLGPDLEIISADYIQEKPLGTMCASLLNCSSINPLKIPGPIYDTWYLNFNDLTVKGHYSQRPLWFLSYVKERYPIPGLLFLASVLVFLFGYLMLFRQRWQFYSLTVNTLFRHSSDAILICDSTDKVLAVNQVLHDLIDESDSSSAPDTRGKWKFAVRRSPPAPGVSELLESSQLAPLYNEAFGGDNDGGTIELLKDNQPVTYNYRLEDMKTRGANKGRILILHDITEQLEETKRTIWKFMSQNTAHRLKSPLQRIKTVAESTIIKRQKGKLQQEEVDGNLQKILDTTRDVNQMIHDFLMVSDRKINPRELDLRRFLMKNIQYYRQKNLSEGVQLRLTIADELPPVMADDYHLLTLLVNLLDNSLKAVKGEGTISVSASLFSETGDSEQEWIRLVVQDDGIGIPREQLPRIFQHHASFFKDGHGIGLAVVYSIIKAHKGRISVESEPGAGTSFFIDLPTMEQSLQ